MFVKLLNERNQKVILGHYNFGQNCLKKTFDCELKNKKMDLIEL